MNTTWRRPGLRGALLYSTLAVFLTGVAALLCRLQVRAPEPARTTQRLPGGPLIVVANHTSFADGILLALACRRMGRSARLLATSGVFDAPVLGRLLSHLGFIPVRRDTEQAKDALAPAAAALAAGEVVAMFPEGRLTRDPDYWPERARTGAVRLALETGAPIVPIAIHGAQNVVGRGRSTDLVRSLIRSLLRVPRVDLLVGEPLHIDHLSTKDSAADARRLTDLMMGQLISQVAQLRGETANHEYGVPTQAASASPELTYR